MNLLNKLERKFGRFYISNLMLYLVIGNVIVFAFVYLFPDLPITSYMYFDRDLIFGGQVWRVLSFLFVPYNFNPIFMLISAYFYWLIGSQLESAWGGFRFNIFYFTGVIGTIIGGLITGYATAYYLNLSLFLAYALLFPNEEFLLMFFIPIKAKYLAYVDVVLLFWEFLISGWGERAAIIVAFLNIALFFGGDYFNKLRDKFRYRKTRRNFKIQMSGRNDDQK